MSEFKKYITAINDNQGQPQEDLGYTMDPKSKIVAVNFDNFKTHADQMTVVCSGAFRGGSSILPYMLTHLGVNMRNIEADTYEDIDMLRNRQSMDAMKKIIAIRNEQDRWGFKIPSIRRGQFGFFEDALRNPVFIYIMRNPILSSQSLVQRSKVDKFSSDKKGFGNALFDCVTSYVEFVAFMRQTKSPCIVVPMENLALAPFESVRFLADTLKLPASDDVVKALSEEVRVSGYKPRKSA